jgi:hypothetical protein
MDKNGGPTDCHRGQCWSLLTLAVVSFLHIRFYKSLRSVSVAHAQVLAAYDNGGYSIFL